jgi:two-component system chemotaxis response regulator CheY
MKMLIVDDMQVSCRVLKGLLTKYGTCDIASNARDAIAAFQNAWKEDVPYRLICLDVMLPEIDGLKALEVLRKMEEAMNLEAAQRAHVIMVSASDDPHHQQKAKELGCDAFLVKPIFSTDLTKCLRDAGLIE